MITITKTDINMKTNDTTNAAPAAVMPRRADAMTATAVSTVMIAASLALLIAECDGWAACDFFALKGVAMAFFALTYRICKIYYRRGLLAWCDSPERRGAQ